MDLKEDLKALRSALPYGSIQRICEKQGRTRQHVNDVLNGKYQDESVIDLAIEEIEKERKRKESLQKRIRAALSL